MRHGVLLAGVLAALAATSAALAQEPGRRQEPLAEQVKRAIDRGVKYLRQNQRPDGSWEIDVSAAGMRGGWTSLALLALLNAGVPADDPAVARGLDWLRRLNSGMTYVRALQTMVYAEAGQLDQDRERIKNNVDWLIKARIMTDGGTKLQGWTYNLAPAGSGDNSNTQYALLGLHAGKTAGIKIPARVWQSIRDYYQREQQEDGGWLYSRRGTPHGAGSSLTMTTAGLSGLLIAGMELNEGRESPRGDGSFNACGVYKENEPVARALAWIGRRFVDERGEVHDNFRLEMPKRTFYNLYGIERAGRLSGLRFFGRHDWYREGCKFLTDADSPNRQHADGSWSAAGYYDQWPVISTSFALLFLSKGRTPVLVSKLVHGPWPRREADHDWNNDRNDLRHLTEFASRELFRKVPLAWQTFDLMRAVPDEARVPGDEKLLEITSDMLQSPILYITGHTSPLHRLRPVEKVLLKKYVENGGFILAEACCGRKEFDAGFRELVRELWPDNDLTDLPAGHPVWSAHFPVKPGAFHLQGLNMGCKTVLVYSPEDLSCLWESNNFEDGRGQLAFRVGANLIAYATGMEPPRPRLTDTELAGTKDDVRKVPRGFLKVAQLQHGGDWQPAPRAMRNLLSHLHRLAGLDVALKTEALPVNHESVVDFKFLYLHGRGDFAFADGQLDKLRFNLKTGGLLLADACCGSPAFDRAFRRFARQLFPDHKLERVPPADELFGKELNGVALTEQNVRCRRVRNGPMQAMAPWLEGIKLDGRWVVLYSKYDLGCALERSLSSDCVGYDPDSALRVAGAAVLYLLRP
jgi:hypothetical protein